MTLSGQDAVTPLPHSQPLGTGPVLASPRGQPLECCSEMGCGFPASPVVKGGKLQPTGWKRRPYWGMTSALLGDD